MAQSPAVDLMRTIRRYILSDLFVTFVMTFVVFTFVMCIGVVFKATDLLAAGAAWRPILRLLVSGMPAAFSFSIPFSALTAVLLVFGRLSADGEITAMRACGLNNWQIAGSPILLAILLMVLCVYINNELAPRSHLQRRQFVSQLSMTSPMDLLEESRFIYDFPGVILYVGKKQDNRIEDVRIYDSTGEVRREIKAEYGFVEMVGTDMVIKLHNGRVDPFFDDRPGALDFGVYSSTITNILSNQPYTPRQDDMTMSELLDGVGNIPARYPDLPVEDRGKQRMLLLVELNKRLALSCACLAFVWLGIPLGVKAHRKESSLGIGLSLCLVFSFYLFIIIAESLSGRPELRPDVIVWVPVVVAMIVGAWLMERSQ